MRTLTTCLLMLAAPAHAGGYFEVSTTDADSSAAIYSSGESVTGLAFAAGYMFIPQFGLELSARDYGSYSAGGTFGPPQYVQEFTAQMSGTAFSAIVAWPFHERFSVYGRVGNHRWHSSGLSPIGVEVRNGGSDTLLGLGLRWGFAEGGALTLSVEDHELSGGGPQLGFRFEF